MQNNQPVSPSHADEETLSLERIVFFSDAVIAIAITLLAIDIRLSPLDETGASLTAALLALWPKYLSFLISFMIIATYWIAHHTMFARIKRFDNTLIWLNFFFLMLIAFTPFPNAIVGEYGDQPSAQVFYAISVGVTGLMKLILWWYASHNHRLVDPELSSQEIRQIALRGAIVPATFLLSIPFAYVHPLIPIALWCSTPLVSALMRRFDVA